MNFGKSAWTVDTTGELREAVFSQAFGQGQRSDGKNSSNWASKYDYLDSKKPAMGMEALTMSPH